MKSSSRVLLLASALIVSLGAVSAPVAFAQDKTTKDTMSKDAMKKDDAMAHDAMKKDDAMGHEAMKKDDAMAHDAMKKDEMKKRSHSSSSIGEWIRLLDPRSS